MLRKVGPSSTFCNKSSAQFYDLRHNACDWSIFLTKSAGKMVGEPPKKQTTASRSSRRANEPPLYGESCLVIMSVRLGFLNVNIPSVKN